MFTITGRIIVKWVLESSSSFAWSCWRKSERDWVRGTTFERSYEQRNSSRCHCMIGKTVRPRRSHHDHQSWPAKRSSKRSAGWMKLIAGWGSPPLIRIHPVYVDTVRVSGKRWRSSFLEGQQWVGQCPNKKKLVFVSYFARTPLSL